MTLALTSSSTTDVSDRINLQDCCAGFERAMQCRDILALAAWAEKWGWRMIKAIETQKEFPENPNAA